MNRLNALLKFFERRYLRIDILPRVILQLPVVLVIANKRPTRWSVGKVNLVEIFVRDPVELLLPVFFRRENSQCRTHTNSDR